MSNELKDKMQSSSVVVVMLNVLGKEEWDLAGTTQRSGLRPLPPLTRCLLGAEWSYPDHMEVSTPSLFLKKKKKRYRSQERTTVIKIIKEYYIIYYICVYITHICKLLTIITI